MKRVTGSDDGMRTGMGWVLFLATQNRGTARPPTVARLPPTTAPPLVCTVLPGAQETADSKVINKTDSPP